MTDDPARDDELAEIPDTAARAQARRVIDEMRTRLHAVHAPPDFHARGMARIRQLPPPQGGLARWWTGVSAWQARSAVWAPALAMALVVSLTLNIWWGTRALRPRPPDVHTTAERWPEGRSAVGPWPTYQFQVQMQYAPTLGALVAARPVPKAPPAMVGFTPDAARPTFVRLGILYADTLAALQSGAVEAAKQRLGVLIQALVNLHAPPVLSQYLWLMQAMLQRQPLAGETAAAGQRQPPAGTTVVQFVALFEPLYQAVYTTDSTDAAWVLFRAGAWLENLALAAAVGDQAAVRQTPEVQQVVDALRQFPMPDAVFSALEQLRALVAQQSMAAGDLRAIQVLVDTLQQQLSGGAP